MESINKADVKIPCINCDQNIFDSIKPHLKKWGYDLNHIRSNWKDYPLLIINKIGELGVCDNVCMIKADTPHYMRRYNREIVDNIDEFLRRAASLKGFEYNENNESIMDNGDLDLWKLKPGMIISKGSLNFIVFPVDSKVSEFELAVTCVEYDYWAPIEEFYNDYISESPEMKVYDYINDRNNLTSGDVIWDGKRDKQETEEYECIMTIQEVADKLGINAKTLKIIQ